MEHGSGDFCRYHAPCEPYRVDQVALTVVQPGEHAGNGVGPNVEQPRLIPADRAANDVAIDPPTLGCDHLTARRGRVWADVELKDPHPQLKGSSTGGRGSRLHSERHLNHGLVVIVTRLRDGAVWAVPASIAVIGRRPCDDDSHGALVRRANGVGPGRRARLHHSTVEFDNVRRLGDIDLKFGRRDRFGAADGHRGVKPLVGKQPACWQVHDKVILERSLATGGQLVRVFD